MLDPKRMGDLNQRTATPRRMRRVPRYPQLATAGLLGLGVAAGASCGGMVKDDPPPPPSQEQPAVDVTGPDAAVPLILGAGGALPEPMPSGVPIE